jgi:uncharacterized SAM-binding protein YcdF (DUF218 family)
VKRLGRSLVYTGAACFVLLLLGFIVFAASATRRISPAVRAADGIVVLTGGVERRIEAGLGLLKKGLGRRLLISGVNQNTRPRMLLAELGALDTCCIDLGYEAQDTIGNAAETRAWAERNGFTRLIVVTSTYHMPRSLAELRREMPDLELAAYAVRPKFLSEGAWWLRPGVARLLGGEYVKLLATYVRCAASSVVQPLPGRSAASTSAGS